MPTKQQLENAVKVFATEIDNLHIYKRDRDFELLHGERTDKMLSALTLAISVLQSLLSYEGKGMPEEKPRVNDFEFVGANEMRQQFILWLQARMPSEDDLYKVVEAQLSFEAICPHGNPEGDCSCRNMSESRRISHSISALLIERLGG